jgi:hypothetical protein
MISLRIGPTGNNQAMHVRWAGDYEFEASLDRNWRVAQHGSRPLESRCRGR